MAEEHQPALHVGKRTEEAKTLVTPQMHDLLAEKARTELAAYKSRRQGGGLVLNTAGKPQATLARATTNNIRLDPAKTVEDFAVQAIRHAQISRPVKAGKKVAA